ncbi:hypothetical protein L873DRAFT_1646962, partial [Choiromyces venosus 120613-1]
LLLLTSIPAATAAGWHMTINYSDGVQTKEHGHANSGCKTFKKTDAKITSVEFDSSLLTDTFVLYRDGDCQRESYKGKKGNNNVPNNVYRSYKVY